MVMKTAFIIFILSGICRSSCNIINDCDPNCEDKAQTGNKGDQDREVIADLPGQENPSGAFKAQAILNVTPDIGPPSYSSINSTGVEPSSFLVFSTSATPSEGDLKKFMFNESFFLDVSTNLSYNLEDSSYAFSPVGDYTIKPSARSTPALESIFGVYFDDSLLLGSKPDKYKPEEKPLSKKRTREALTTHTSPLTTVIVTSVITEAPVVRNFSERCVGTKVFTEVHTVTITASTPMGYHPTSSSLQLLPDVEPKIAGKHPDSYISIEIECSWSMFCQNYKNFSNSVAELMAEFYGTQLRNERVKMMNMHNCLNLTVESAAEEGSALIIVLLFIQEELGDKSDKFLTHQCAQALQKSDLLFPSTLFRSKIIAVHEYCRLPCPMNGRILHKIRSAETNTNDLSVVAVSVLAAVVIVCLVLVAVLMAILRNRYKKRKKRTNCAQLDGHSLSNLSIKSIRSSLRSRKFLRSRRSYVNFAFSDKDAPSQLLNSAALVSYASNESLLKKQFETIPMIVPRRNELPPGVEPKNRYANGIPIPETRVSLSLRQNCPNSDYINANFVRGYKDEINCYMACQAPLDSTIEDFWRMIWENQCSVIVMLTLLEEAGVNKCSDYFPCTSTLDCHRSYNEFRITLVHRDEREKYIISTFHLRHLEENLMREVHHFWYTNWPTVGVPENPYGLLSFLEECQSYMRVSSGSTVVHCSAGTGRTGVFICADICMQQLKTSGFVDILNCVYKSRHDRSGMVKTKEQYAFIYQLIAEYSEKLGNASKRPSLKSEISANM